MSDVDRADLATRTVTLLLTIGVDVVVVLRRSADLLEQHTKTAPALYRWEAEDLALDCRHLAASIEESMEGVG